MTVYAKNNSGFVADLFWIQIWCYTSRNAMGTLHCLCCCFPFQSFHSYRAWILLWLGSKRLSKPQGGFHFQSFVLVSPRFCIRDVSRILNPKRHKFKGGRCFACSACFVWGECMNRFAFASQECIAATGVSGSNGGPFTSCPLNTYKAVKGDAPCRSHFNFMHSATHRSFLLCIVFLMYSLNHVNVFSWYHSKCELGGETSKKGATSRQDCFAGKALSALRTGSRPVKVSEQMSFINKYVRWKILKILVDAKAQIRGAMMLLPKIIFIWNVFLCLRSWVYGQTWGTIFKMPNRILQEIFFWSIYVEAGTNPRRHKKRTRRTRHRRPYGRKNGIWNWMAQVKYKCMCAMRRRFNNGKTRTFSTLPWFRFSQVLSESVLSPRSG